MDSYDTGRLIYLVLLGSVIAAYFFVSNRDRLGQAARQAVLWGLIFLGVIAGYGLWGDIRNEVLPRQAVIGEGSGISVPRAPDGHFYLTLDINGTPVQFVVDTGATDIVLNQQDAARVGLDINSLAYTGIANTANGTVRIARARLGSIALGPIRDDNVFASVNEGALDTSLLGMSYLQRFDRLEISNGTLVLER